MDEKDDRNPLLIPTGKESARLVGCPKCRANDYVGRVIQGVVNFTCMKCRNAWQGGLPQLPQDPTIPLPAQDPMHKPLVDFVRDKSGQVREVRRAASLVQEFRKGLPIPEGDE